VLRAIDTYLDRAVADLEATTDRYRILRRFEERARYSSAVIEPRRGVYIDTETTGLDEDAKVVELALRPFVFCAETGVVGDIYPVIRMLEDPEEPLTPEVSAINGLTDEMLRNQRFDDALVEETLGEGHLCIAHHAEFDRPKLERRFPSFASAFWACSFKDVSWRDHGFTCSQLAHLLQDGCREFHDAHSAVDDAAVGLHLLASIRVNDAPALQTLLTTARIPSYHVWALDAPFDVKDELKFAQPTRYEWNDGTDGRPKAWHVAVRGEAALVHQLEFLRDVYGPSRIGIRRITAKDRYSIRELGATPSRVLLADALAAASAALISQSEG